MSETKIWVSLTAIENIPVREGRSVQVGGRKLAIFNLGNRFLAVENRCPHRGGPLADGIERFLAYKRALGRRFDTEEKQLRLFDRFLVRHAPARVEDITPELLAQFLTGRPRPRPRSYNQLLGVLRRLFDWLVSQDILPQSPVRAHPRRVTAQQIP